MSYNKTNTCIKILPFFLFIILICGIFKINETKPQNTINVMAAEEATSTLLEENQDKELIQNKVLDQKYRNIVFKKDKTYISYFIDMRSGKYLEIKDLLKKDEETSLEEKIKELLSLKYPKFIVEQLKNSNIAYEFQENKLHLYYSNYQITPQPKEEIFLNVNYKEIADLLNFTVSIKEENERENGYNYSSDKKTVALTFDDGPNVKTTGKLIELLEQNKMHATFFMVGNRMSNAKELIKIVIEKGNEIGSHSYNHANLTRIKKEEMIENEQITNQLYKDITGQDLKLLRPPYGSINNIMKQNLNYVFVNWSLDTEDWRYRNKEHVYNAVLENIKDGDIILMHDLYESTVEAVEELLPELYVRGFQVTTVSELAKLKGTSLEKKQVYRYIR